MKRIHCPRCGAAMTSAVREGIEVDICRACRGVWFDRGEVERLLHRVTAVDDADLPATWEYPDELLVVAT